MINKHAQACKSEALSVLELKAMCPKPHKPISDNQPRECSPKSCHSWQRHREALESKLPSQVSRLRGTCLLSPSLCLSLSLSLSLSLKTKSLVRLEQPRRPDTRERARERDSFMFGWKVAGGCWDQASVRDAGRAKAVRGYTAVEAPGKFVWTFHAL